MPFVLIGLRRVADERVTARLVRRYSFMALLSVLGLVFSGVFLAKSLVGNWQALYGTSYGLSLSVKLYLFLLIAHARGE